MELNSSNCVACSTLIVESAAFCHECGVRLKCKSCNAVLVKNAKHCISCGVSVVSIDGVSTAMNTIKFHKTQDEISYEVSLTDEVGKEGISELIANLTNNRTPEKQIGAPTSIITDKQEIAADAIILNDVEEDKSSSNQNISSDSTEEEFPHLNDVEMNINCSESDWLLIYAFYESGYAKNPFSKEAVYQKYMDKRKTTARSKNYSANWKSLFKKDIATIKENTFKFKPEGLTYVKSIILGNGSTPTKKMRKKATSSKDINDTTTDVSNKKRTPSKSIVAEEFDAYKGPKKMSLEDFLKERQSSNTADRIAVIGYYITKINNAPLFTEGQIDYAYKTLQLNNRPNHLRQTIINLKNEYAWFVNVNEDGKRGWKLDRSCEIYVEEKLLHKATK